MPRSIASFKRRARGSRQRRRAPESVEGRGATSSAHPEDAARVERHPLRPARPPKGRAAPPASAPAPPAAAAPPSSGVARRLLLSLLLRRFVLLSEPSVDERRVPLHRLIVLRQACNGRLREPSKRKQHRCRTVQDTTLAFQAGARLWGWAPFRAGGPLRRTP